MSPPVRASQEVGVGAYGAEAAQPHARVHDSLASVIAQAVLRPVGEDRPASVSEASSSTPVCVACSSGRSCKVSARAPDRAAQKSGCVRRGLTARPRAAPPRHAVDVPSPATLSALCRSRGPGSVYVSQFPSSSFFSQPRAHGCCASQVVEGRTWHIRRPDNTQRAEKSLLVVLKLVKAGHRRVSSPSLHTRSLPGASSCRVAPAAPRARDPDLDRSQNPQKDCPLPDLPLRLTHPLSKPHPVAQAASTGLDFSHHHARGRAQAEGCRGAPFADGGLRRGA